MLDIVLVHLIVVGVMILFATDRVRVDVVALLLLVVLMVLGVWRPATQGQPGFPSPDQVLMGFSNRATVTVATMFVLSAGLVRTGAVNWISRGIVHLGGHNASRAMVLLFVTVGAMSAFINNTAALAVFMPITLAIAREYSLSPSRVLIPLSYITIVGGTCTLIGTSTNILVSAISADHGMGEIPMFELARLGVILFVITLGYLYFAGRRLLPDREIPSGLTRKYRLSNYLTRVVVGRRSPLVGKTPTEARLSERFDVNILQITRDNETRWFGLRDTHLQVGDQLLVRGDANDIMRLKELDLAIHAETKFADEDLASEMTALAEGMIPPSSALVGLTLKDVDFRHKYGVFALALRKHGRTIRKKIADIRLEVGDTLLLQGRKALMDSLGDLPDFLVLRELDLPRVRETRAIYAVSIITGVVVVATAGLLPIMVAALLGALLMVATGCITVKEAYESLDWSVIFLLAGVIPLGLALETTGTAEFVVKGVIGFADVLGPVAIISALFILTAAMTAVMSNNATAILLAPIAIVTAAELGASPWPFLMAIAFGASASFSTPVGYQTNLMVYGPGGYRYRDYLRAGIPLTIIFWIVCTILIPVLWPL